MDAPRDIETLREHLARAIDKIADLTPQYKDALEYWDGTKAEKADSRAARSVIRQSQLTPMSFAHIPVDVIAEKVALSSITSPDASARGILERWVDTNDLDDESVDWIHKACMFGDYYVITDPTGFDEDGVAQVEDIDSVGASPLSTIVVYDKKTQRKKEFGAHFWDAGTKQQPVTRAFLYYDDCSVKLVAQGENVVDADLFTFDVAADEETDAAFLDHDGGRMLIAHLAVGGKPYGEPVHKKAWGPQDAITKISANNLVNVDALGLPSRWALIDPNAEIDDDIDDDFGTDGPNTASGSGDGRRDATTGRRVRTVPGAIEYLRGVSETGTYDTAETTGFLANLDWYVRAMAVTCGIALHEFDLKGDQPSGESRRRAEGRQNRTAARIKNQAAAFFRELADTVLGLSGREAQVEVSFNPTETSTDKDGIELISLKIKAGVPVRAALLEAGYTDEQVNEWYPEDRPALSPDLLTTLAEVLSKLGNAITLGALPETAVAEMLPQVFDYIDVAREVDPLANVVTDPATQAIVTNAGSELKAKADALGILVRAGADPEQAADAVETGDLTGLTFPNVPVTIRIPETQATGLEGTGAPAPAAPGSA